MRVLCLFLAAHCGTSRSAHIPCSPSSADAVKWGRVVMPLSCPISGSCQQQCHGSCLSPPHKWWERGFITWEQQSQGDNQSIAKRLVHCMQHIQRWVLCHVFPYVMVFEYESSLTTVPFLKQSSKSTFICNLSKNNLCSLFPYSMCFLFIPAMSECKCTLV